MANSIANLAVVISGHTKPLEEAMNKAKSKMGSFGKSIASGFGHGLGIGAGVLGIDNIEQAIKKALGGSERLRQAAEQTEESFGNIIVKLTMMDKWLPKVSDALKDAADKTPSVIDRFWLGVETLKEEAAYLAYRTTMPADAALARIVDMRKEYMKLVAVEKWEADLQENKAKAEKNRLESIKEIEEVIDGLLSERAGYDKEGVLEAQMDRIGSMIGQNDPHMIQARRLIKDNKELAEEKKAVEEITKLQEDWQKVIDDTKFPVEQLADKQFELNMLYGLGKINTDQYNKALEATKEKLGLLAEAYGPVTAQQAKHEKLNALIMEARDLIEEQIPEVEKLRAKYEEAQDAFLNGVMNVKEFDAISNAYNNALKNQNQAKEVQVAGATTGADAYSSIVHAMANKGRDDDSTAQKALAESIKQTKIQAAQLEEHRKRANGAGYIQLRVLSLGKGS